MTKKIICACLILLAALPVYAQVGGSQGGGGGVGGGDASLAEQQTQTGLLTTIDADTGTIAGAVKNEDAAHNSGEAGIPFWGVRNDSASVRTDANGDYSPVSVDSTGRILINPGVSASSLGKNEDAAHISGDVGVAVLTKRTDTAASSAGTDGDYATLNSDADGNLRVTDSGTSTLHYATSAASTNATNVKASAGTISTLAVVNTTATLYYLRMYNLASAPTCSSATGFVNTIPIPASTSGAGIVIPITVPHAFTTGIGYCLTGGGSSTDNTNAATGVYINLWYK